MDTRSNLVLAAASLLLMAGLAQAQAPTATTIREETDAIVLANGALTVTFLGKAPDLELASAANATPALGYRYVSLVEFRDLDANGAPTPNEVVASLDLADTSGWQANKTEGAPNASMSLTLTAPVELAAGASSVVPTPVPTSAPNLTLPDRTATVSLTFTLQPGARSVDVALSVAKWPALGAGDTRLALLMDATGELALDEGSGNVTGNATEVGALTWATNASGTTTDGGAVEVPVRAQTTPSGENATSLAFVYDAAGLATLDHDAGVGLADGLPEKVETGGAGGAVESIKDVPAPALLAVLVVVATAGIVLRRR